MNRFSDTTIIKTDSTGRFIYNLSPGEYHLTHTNGYLWLNDTTAFVLNESRMKYLTFYYGSTI